MLPDNFYLTTHQIRWLERYEIPLFVSHVRMMWRSWDRQLPRRKRRGRYALDSGGYSWLSKAGRWVQPWQMAEYGQSLLRYYDQIGEPDFVCIQDWMCEPEILKKTGLTVRQHQELTVANYTQFRYLMPQVPWVPVLQGWRDGDHLRHYEMYVRAGHDLSRAPVVGVGSICRLASSSRGRRIVTEIFKQTGLKLHGFGLKTLALEHPEVTRALHSSDSLAWSDSARHRRPLPGHTHKSCSSCPAWAMTWREKVLALLDSHRDGAQRRAALPWVLPR